MTQVSAAMVTSRSGGSGVPGDSELVLLSRGGPGLRRWQVVADGFWQREVRLDPAAVCGGLTHRFSGLFF